MALIAPVALLAFAACTVEQPAADDDDGGAATSNDGTGGAQATGPAGSGGSGAGPTVGAGGAPTGPETSAQSLARQQALHGWGPENCPAGASGTTVGSVLSNITLYDCEGNPVDTSAFCGADAAWYFFAHGWCPHCQLTGSFAEELHASYAGSNLAGINVLVETAAGGPPTGADCQAWREQYGHADVITLHDPTGAATVLWEENFTALNLVVDDDVVSEKLHTDQQNSIKFAIDQALD